MHQVITMLTPILHGHGTNGGIPPVPIRCSITVYSEINYSYTDNLIESVAVKESFAELYWPVAGAEESAE